MWSRRFAARLLLSILACLFVIWLIPYRTLPDSTEFSHFDKLKCLIDRGEYKAYGLIGAYQCNMLTKDGGTACRDSNDCEELCLAKDGGTCSYWTLNFGTNVVLENGKVTYLHVD